MTDEQHPRGADGQTPSSDDPLAPTGEELVSGRLPDTEGYEVVDDEAEELAESEGEPDLTPDKGDPEDMVIDDPEQLGEAEDAARKARSSRPRRRTAAVKAAEEDSSESETDEAESPHVPRREITKAPTRRAKLGKDDDQDEGGRANPVKFTKQSVAELKKVKWPTAAETGQYFLVVLVFVLLIIAVVGGLDALFAWGLLKTLGN
ncbi:preprotein translocase subunit SecE [Acidipropionibacterium virtanenii]|uniref:Protein translocase subunit SecE n=1 Tax=Acidipropionibacterium virtanenii TaxID=2057246 RepID=A0A344US55_9ACTN|nr:preprotein translocase subunit SecE [Acidipropionibacterium virtanenii]AXE38103.1 Protein translocase subunit SecE [Acidipropionibacterium virtanenii]